MLLDQQLLLRFTVTSLQSELAPASLCFQLSSWEPSTMQDAPRRLLAMPFLSAFFQGRRHSTSEPVLQRQQDRCGSTAKILSSSSLQVMVAVVAIQSAERNPTCPERKSKVLFPSERLPYLWA